MSEIAREREREREQIAKGPLTTRILRIGIAI